MNRERNEQFMRARFDLSQDDQTCVFSEQIDYDKSELSAAWKRWYEQGDGSVLGMSVTKMMELRRQPAAQTCVFSEQAHHVELANRDEQEGEDCAGMDRFIVGLVVFAGLAIAVGIIVASNLPRWFS